jgi:hypothetical protein
LLQFSVRNLVAAIFVVIASMQLLFFAFLGYSAIVVVGAGLGLGLIAIAIRQMPGWDEDISISLRLLSTVAFISLVILILGGEGRFFYANSDWTVRNAVLRDLVTYPWPFVYDAPNGNLLLRLPIGMYLAPALIGKLFGFYAAELAMLFQNSLLLALIFAAGAALYTSIRSRMMALAVFVGFSGMDIIGQFLTKRPLTLHLEQWAGPQYSAHLTQAFWVPQHAMAGWVFAIFYLLWVEKRAPRVAMFAIAPLLALFSPLALIGCIPFAIHAGIIGLRDRSLSKQDILLPLIAVIIAVPSLLYLTAAGESVGGGASKLRFAAYISFIVFELGLYLFALFLLRGRVGFGRVTTAVTIAMLLILPFGQIGGATDLVMRASIPALAIFSLTIAGIFMQRRDAADKNAVKARLVALIAFLIGLATPLGEIVRAVTYPASPEMKCSYLGIVPGGAPTYVARLDRMPSLVAPINPTSVKPIDPLKCWEGQWPDAVTGRETIVG